MPFPNLVGCMSGKNNGLPADVMIKEKTEETSGLQSAVHIDVSDLLRSDRTGLNLLG